MKRGGVVLLLLVIAVLGLALLGAAVLLRRPMEGGKSSSASASVLIFDVPYDLEEADVPAGSYSLAWLMPEHPTLYQVVSALRAAAHDDRIESLVLHIEDLDWGWAKIAEVREAIKDFRASGKPVYANLSGGGEKEYLLAAAANQVSAPPLAVLWLNGLSASALFMKGTFDKLDISPNFSHAGTYKSGVEGYTRKDMSPPAREALQSLLDDLYVDLVDSLAVSRDMDADSVVAMFERGPFDTDQAWSEGLIDTVLYQAEMDSMVVGDNQDDSRTITLTHYIERMHHPTGPRIALVTAAGVISEGRSHQGAGGGLVLGSETIIRALQDARERSSIKAIILRIDSPGGSAPASDEIWREVERCREEKPVIASMSDYAASGGYYIAVGADSIVAQAGTITGSIGVYGGKLNILGLYRKLGLNVETVTRGPHAEMLSPYKDFSPEEAQRFQHGLETVYQTFVNRVADGRGLDSADVEQSAEGHVWSGTAALDRALVDRLGGLPEAIAMAKKLAKIPASQEVSIEVFPKVERNFLQRWLAALWGSDEDDEDALARTTIPAVMRAWIEAARFPSGVALALLPFDIDIH
jgi:protease-4